MPISTLTGEEISLAARGYLKLSVHAVTAEPINSLLSLLTPIAFMRANVRSGRISTTVIAVTKHSWATAHQQGNMIEFMKV